MRKCHMPDDAFAKESAFVPSCSRSIKELIGNNEVSRCILFLQTTDGRDRQNVLDAEQLHCVDVCAEGKLAWCQFVASAVSRKKRDCHAVQFTNNKRIGRTAKWRFDRDFTHVLQFRHLIQTAAADDPDPYSFHLFLAAAVKTRNKRGKFRSEEHTSELQ